MSSDLQPHGENAPPCICGATFCFDDRDHPDEACPVCVSIDIGPNGEGCPAVEQGTGQRNVSGGLRLTSGRVISNECAEELDHVWAGTDDGHNCTGCDPSSIWKCDKEAHWIPRFEEDPVAHRLGFHEDGCACPDPPRSGRAE